RRNFLVGRCSISRAAERLISRLNLATPAQVPNDALESEAGLLGALFECRQVLGILGKAGTNRVVHEVRDRSLAVGSLVAKSPVDVGVEIDGGTLGWGPHASRLAL